MLEKYILFNQLLMKTQEAFLPNLFKQLWENQTKNPWIDGLSGKKLDQALNIKLFQNESDPKIIQKLQKCTLKEWDITLLSKIIMQLEISDEQKKAIKSIRNLRNNRSHVKKSLQDIDYDNNLKELQIALITIGTVQKDIEQIQKITENQLNKNESLISNQDIIEQGLKYVKDNLIVKALDCFNEKLKSESIDNNDKAIIYLERSKCYLMIYLEDKQQDKLSQSIEDVYESQFFNPFNEQTYIQLCLIYFINDTQDVANSFLEQSKTISNKTKNNELEKLIQNFSKNKIKSQKQLKDIYDCQKSKQETINSNLNKDDILMLDIKINYLFQKVNKIFEKSINDFWFSKLNKSIFEERNEIQIIQVFASVKFKKPEIEKVKNLDLDTQLYSKIILEQEINLNGRNIQKYVKEIRNIRNEYYHLTDFQQNTYHAIINSLKSCLINIGSDKQEIEDLLNRNYHDFSDIHQETLSKEQNSNKYLELKQQGNNFFKTKKYEDAIHSYSQGIKIQDVSDHQKSIIFLNRSLCYLNQYEQNPNEKKQNLQFSTDDAQQSLLYNPFYPKAHYRLAKIYFIENQLERAQNQINYALQLEPDSQDYKEIKSQIACKIIEIRSVTRTIEENNQMIKNTFEETTGLNYQDFKDKNLDQMIQVVPGNLDVFIGHDYRDGANQYAKKKVKNQVCYETAAKFYFKSISQNNPEGCYNLYVLVIQKKINSIKLEEAIQYLVRAANDQRKYKFTNNPLVGIPESQYSLGLIYYNGGYYQKNIQMGVYWYEKASDNGIGSASNNLAIYYLESDPEKSERYFLRAIQQNDINAPQNYAINKAQGKFKKKVQQKKSNENTQNLSSQYIFHESLQSSYFQQKVEKFHLNYQYLKKENLIDQKTLSQFKNQKNVQNLLKSIQLFDETIKYLNDQSLDSDQSFINNFANSITTHDSVIGFLSYYQIQKIKQIIQKIINIDKDNQDNLNARIIKIYIENEFLSENSLEFIQQSDTKYKNNKIIKCALGFYQYSKKQYKQALEFYEQAIQIDQQDYELLYFKSIILFDSLNKDSINYLNEYQKKSQQGHPFYTNTFYLKALWEIMHNNINCNTNIILEQYEKGIDSEKKLLPFYLPFDSQNKLQLEKYFEKNKIKPNLIISVDHFRKLITLHNRNMICMFFKHDNNNQNYQKIIQKDVFPGKHTINYQNNYKKISFNQLIQNSDQLYTNCYMQVKVIDYPCVGEIILLIIQDENNHYSRLSISELGDNFQQIRQYYRIGCKLKIYNPFYRFKEGDGFPLIKMLDPSNIEIIGYENVSCIICQKNNISEKCNLCFQVYCSIQCKILDQEELNHKLVCQAFKQFNRQFIKHQDKETTREHTDITTNKDNTTDNKKTKQEEILENREKMQVLKTLKGHSHSVLSLVLLSNGQLASGSVDQTIKIWDVEKGKCLKTLKGHNALVFSLVMLSNRQLASASRDQTIKIWDVETGQCLKTLKGHSGSVMSLVLLQNGQLASGSGSFDESIKIWDIEKCQCLKTLKGHSKSVLSLVLLSNRQLASGSFDYSIKIWDVEKGKCLKTLKGHNYSVYSLVLLSNEQLASCSGDQTIKIWDVETGQCLKTLRGHSNEVYSLVLLTNGLLASSSKDQTIKIWDVETGQCSQTLEVPSSFAFYLVLLRNGWLASASDDKTIKIWK